MPPVAVSAACLLQDDFPVAAPSSAALNRGSCDCVKNGYKRNNREDVDHWRQTNDGAIASTRRTGHRRPIRKVDGGGGTTSLVYVRRKRKVNGLPKIYGCDDVTICRYVGVSRCRCSREGK